ncbi:MAG: RteC domain-containing protein [Saprospiraceae bacterium]|nr:RteC domain-containing protein [Saprospiraceae bacterium]
MLLDKLLSILSEFENVCSEVPHTECSALPLIQFRRDLFNQLSDVIVEIESDFEFSTIEDEIRYYKFIKPQFYKYGVFYKSIYKIVSRYPVGLKKGSKKYYFDCLKDVKDTFDRQVDMFEYYRGGYVNNDHVIFRKNFEERNIFAVLQGTQMIEDFLHNATDPRTFEEKLKDYPKYKWTGTKIEAVVLVNVLVKGGKINNGNVSIKEIIDYFSVMFDIDLKDCYKKYKDAKGAGDPFKFLDYLKEVFAKDVEEEYE